MSVKATVPPRRRWLSPPSSKIRLDGYGRQRPEHARHRCRFVRLRAGVDELVLVVKEYGVTMVA
jgi:hypothetical protein